MKRHIIAFCAGDMKLTERYHRLNRETIELVITVDDPKIYTRPWVSEKEDVYDPADHRAYRRDCAPIGEVDNFKPSCRDPAGGVTWRQEILKESEIGDAVGNHPGRRDHRMLLRYFFDAHGLHSLR